MRLQKYGKFHCAMGKFSMESVFIKLLDLTVPFTFVHEALAHSYVGNTKLNWTSQTFVWECLLKYNQSNA